MSRTPRHLIGEQPVDAQPQGPECQNKSLDLILKAVGRLGGILWEEGSVSKLNVADTEGTTLEGSDRGPTWGRREETQQSLKGAFSIYWSKFFSTLGQNSWFRAVSHYLQTLRDGALTPYSLHLRLESSFTGSSPQSCHCLRPTQLPLRPLSQMTCQEG